MAVSNSKSIELNRLLTLLLSNLFDKNQLFPFVPVLLVTRYFVQSARGSLPEVVDESTDLRQTQ